MITPKKTLLRYRPAFGGHGDTAARGERMDNRASISSEF